jgi:hypothetical protein
MNNIRYDDPLAQRPDMPFWKAALILFFAVATPGLVWVIIVVGLEALF